MGDAAFEHVEMFGQRERRLHHVQVVHLCGIDPASARGKKIRLLLVVAFEANAVAGLQHRFEQGAHVRGRNLLALGEGGCAGEPRLPIARLTVPVSHEKAFP